MPEPAKNDSLFQARGLTMARLDDLTESNKVSQLDSQSGDTAAEGRVLNDTMPRNFMELFQKTEKLQTSAMETLRSKALRPGSIGASYDDSLKILSKKKFDALKLKEEIDAYQPKQAIGYGKDATSVADFITHVTDDLVWNQIFDATGRVSGSFTERVVEQTHSSWAEKEWGGAKTKLMDSIGHRAMKWRNVSVAQQRQSNRAAIDKESFIDSREGSVLVRGLIQGMTPSANTSSGVAASGGMSVVPRSTKMYGLPMSSFASEHAHVVHELSLRRQLDLPVSGASGSASGTLRPAKDFLEIINGAIRSDESTEADSLSRRDLEGYADVMQYIAEICGEYKRTPVPPGSLSSICFDKATSHADDINAGEREAIIVHARVMRRVRLELTRGGKRHLENQMRSLWEDFVDDAIQRGRMVLHPLVQGEGESGRQKIRAYVRIRDQSRGYQGGSSFNMRSPRDNEATPLWSYVYHCLRIGDIDGAIVELKASKAAGLHVETEIIVALDIMNSVSKNLEQASSESPFVSDKQVQLLTTLEANDLTKALNACQQLYFTEDQQQDPARKSMYRLFVLNLISLSDISLFSTSPEEGSAPEIEHYLWGSMWYIQWNGILKICGFDSLPDDIPDNGELDLYAKILGFGGEEYFESSGGDASDPTYEPLSPYVYAKVLICCQRFGDAINYLWRKGQIFPAIHLSVVCMHYGLILPCQPLTENPIFRGAHPHTESGVGYGNPEPVNIINVYISAPFMLDYPEQSVDYIMCLDADWQDGVETLRDKINPDHLFWESLKVATESRLTKECTHLFTSLRRSQLIRVCGSVNMDLSGVGGTSNDSIRSSGYIDRHITQPGIVNKLLSQAAHHLLNNERDAEGAIYLYQLAGRFADVIEELINQLGMVIVPPDNERHFWIQHATAFYETYILKCSGTVVQSLQKSGLAHLSKHLSTTLALCTFHDHCVQGNHQEALKVLDAVELFPGKEADVAKFALMYSQKLQHPAVRKSTDGTLLSAMKCIEQLYFQRRNAGADTSSDVAMAQLRGRSQALVRFSIAIGASLRPDTPQRLSAVESTLM